MAHTKAKGTSKLGRDSSAQRLGIKKYAGETVSAGEIIVRQRGTKYHAGHHTKLAKDDSIIAQKSGTVGFYKKNSLAFTGRLKPRTFVKIVAGGK